MNQFALRMYVRSLINEAKEENKDKEPKKTVKKEADNKAPKSSGKLVDLKKELAALKQYKDELMAAKFAEKTASTEVEFSDLAKFAKELDALKAKGVALEKQVDDKIAELETRISDEKNKIKEMMGLVPEKKDAKKIVGEKKELNEGQVIRILKDFKLGDKDFKKGDRVGTQPDFDNIIKAKEKGTDYTIAVGGFKNEARFKKVVKK
jgi:hypothetical protein